MNLAILEKCPASGLPLVYPFQGDAVAPAAPAPDYTCANSLSPSSLVAALMMMAVVVVVYQVRTMSQRTTLAFSFHRAAFKHKTNGPHDVLLSPESPSSHFLSYCVRVRSGSNLSPATS